MAAPDEERVRAPSVELGRRESDAALRVLSADGPPVFRAGLRTLLSRVGDLVLAGEAHDGHDAARQVVQLRPNVVILTLDPANPKALASIRRVASSAPNTHVLVLTSDAGLWSLVEAVRAGARGYVLSSAGEEEIIHAIRSVARGEATFGTHLADRVLEHIATARPPLDHSFEALTDREREVLALLARGASTGQIALGLRLSAKTVRNYVSSICTKLGVVDRTQAALRAREAGLPQPSSPQGDQAGMIMERRWSHAAGAPDRAPADDRGQARAL